MISDSAAYAEMTLRDYVRVLFRHQAVIVTAIMTVVTTTFIGLKLKTPVYEAQVKVLISAEKQVEATYYREIPGARNTEMALTQSEIVRSNPILERTVKALRLYQRPLDYERPFASPLKYSLIDFKTARVRNRLTGRSPDQQQMSLFRLAVEDLKGRVTVQPVRDTNLFTISVREFSPVGAAITANTVSRSYVIFDLEQQLAELRLKYGEKHQTVQQLTDNIHRMSDSLAGGPISDIEAIGPASVKIMEQASIPMGPVGPPKVLILALAALMSLFLGVILAFVFEYLDQTVKSPQDIRGGLRLPYLGFVPQRRFWNRAFVRNPDLATPYVQAYRALADQLYLEMRSQGLKALLVTAVAAAEGVTTVTANLGVCLARRVPGKVLLIDANLRQPELHTAFGLPDAPGLADVLDGRETLEQVLRQTPGGLAIVPAGRAKADPAALLESLAMSELLRQAKAGWDLVLIDCAQMRGYPDSVILAAGVDGMTLIVREGRARRQVLQAALGPLAHVRTKLLGAILNGRRLVIPKVIYEWV